MKKQYILNLIKNKIMEKSNIGRNNPEAVGISGAGAEINSSLSSVINVFSDKLIKALFIGGMAIGATGCASNGLKANNSLDSVNTNNVSLIARNGSVGVGMNANKVYREVTTNFGDKYGIGGAYNENGVVVGGSVSKADEGMQYGLGAGYVGDVSKKIFAGGFVKGTKFNANNGFADADSIKARAFLGTDITNNFSIEGGAEYTNTESDGYDTKTNTSPYLGATYNADNGWSLRAYGNDKKVGFSLNIPFGGGSKNVRPSRTLIAQNNMAQDISNSSWNSGIVRAEKAPEVVPTTISSPTINTIGTQNINDNGGFANVAVTTVSGTNINPGATYSIVSDPTSGKLTIDSNTGVATWLGDESSNQSYNITIKVTNTDGGVDTETFTLNVTNNL